MLLLSSETDGSEESRLEERNNKYPKVSKCLGFRQLRLWFFSGCTNVPGLVPRPTKLFYDVFPALSGQGSGMLSPGGNLELRAVRDGGGDKADWWAGWGWEGRVCRAEKAVESSFVSKKVYLS